MLARAAILSNGRPTGVDDLPLADAGNAPATDRPQADSLSLKDLLAETERRAILLALEQDRWNRTNAARLLGISRRQLFDKIRQYGLAKE
ncbi:MAG TPA: helix-turn-helix domain-containing protein [Gemmataceae bacterium]|nr:helix-turn-helix domain-containing protein [Gemmataceae bacterium]